MDDDLGFTHRGDQRLAAGSDEDLVAHIRDAYARGDGVAVSDTFELLVFRHERRIGALLRSKVPPDRVEELAQDVYLAVFEGVIGDSRIENFRAWMTRVARNTVAELWRGKEGRQIKQDREAAVRERDDPGRPAHAEPAVDGGFTGAEAWQLVEQLLARRSEQHRLIVELYVFDGCTAAETVRRTGASADNVYQVARRFRVDLRRLLDGGDLKHNDDPGPAGRTGSE
jgi:RNA polymerase sigma factor (sigma-70 family)